MNRYLSGVMVAVFAAASLLTAPAFADHRPGNVVVMGGTISQTGRYIEPAGRQHNGVKLYVEELNARDGLLGHKVELRIYDDKSDVRTAIELYEKLITEDKVDLVLGPYSSHLTDPVANVMERYKRPFVAGTAASPEIYQRGRKYIFGADGLGTDFQKGALQLAGQIGINRIAIVTRTERVARAAASGARDWAEGLRLKVVLSERYPQDQTDFTDLLKRIKASGAEAIIANTRLRDSVALIRQLRELKINVKLISATIGPTLPEFVEELGGTAEYVLTRVSWELTPALMRYPDVRMFSENYEKRHGTKPTGHVAAGYAAMQVLEAAVKKAGNFDPKKIRDALASMTVQTVRGPWKADERGMGTFESLTIQIQNGKRVVVWPAHMAEARFLPMPRWEDREKK